MSTGEMFQIHCTSLVKSLNVQSLISNHNYNRHIVKNVIYSNSFTESQYLYTDIICVI